MRSLREPSWAVSHWPYKRAPWVEVTWAEVESREKVLGRVHIGPGGQAHDCPPLRPPSSLAACLGRPSLHPPRPYKAWEPGAEALPAAALL